MAGLLILTLSKCVWIVKPLQLIMVFIYLLMSVHYWLVFNLPVTVVVNKKKLLFITIHLHFIALTSLAFNAKL